MKMQTTIEVEFLFVEPHRHNGHWQLHFMRRVNGGREFRCSRFIYNDAEQMVHRSVRKPTGSELIRTAESTLCREMTREEESTIMNIRLID